MPNVSTVTAVWTGFIGSPGYTKIHFQEITTAGAADTATGAVRAFFFALRTHLKQDWHIKVQRVLQNYDVQTGKLVAEYTAGTDPADVTGTQLTTAAYTGGSGAVVDWLTGVILAGRKVRGRTFIVPLSDTVYSPDGTISSTFQSDAVTAGNALISTAGVVPVVWTKVFTKPDPPDKPEQIDGHTTPINSTLVPDRSAQLRTRRQ